MARNRLTPAEARGLFARVVREETARLAQPYAPLSDLADPTEQPFFDQIRAQFEDEAFYTSAMHLHEVAAAYAAPLPAMSSNFCMAVTV